MILLACALCLTAAYAASSKPNPVLGVQFRLSKTGANDDDFLYDRNDGLAAATKTSWLGLRPGYLSSRRDLKTFYDCMTGKGYKADPNGPFRARVYGQLRKG
jgi:hypothetical protein